MILRFCFNYINVGICVYTNSFKEKHYGSNLQFQYDSKMFFLFQPTDILAEKGTFKNNIKADWNFLYVSYFRDLATSKML